jgi:NADH/NAD ratio-sensing transcriptional regulator Rex
MHREVKLNSVQDVKSLTWMTREKLQENKVWNVTYFGVFNFGTSYLEAKIGQIKTMTKISRFTIYVSHMTTDMFNLSLQPCAHSCIITWFVTRVTRRMPRVEQ